MLRMRPEHEGEIRRHGEESYPHECCGFLIGEERNGIKQVTEVRRAGNARDDSPKNRYLIEPVEFMRAQREAAAQGLDVVGIYHSHPNVAARPSQFDRDHAWPWYSYVIVSVCQGQSREMFSWIVENEDAPFVGEAYEVGETRASPAAAAADP